MKRVCSLTISCALLLTFFVISVEAQELRKPKVTTTEKTIKYKTLFQRHETWSLIIGRIIPGSRLFLSATAGIMDISIIKASILTSVGILIWNSIIFHSGMLLGANWEIVKKALRQYSTIVNVLIIALILIVIVWKIYLPVLRKKHE